MASISSVGIGSGVLTSELIEKLADAERAPTEARLDRKEEEVNAKLSAYGRLRSAITELRLPARTLGNPEAMREQTFTSSNSSFSGTLSSTAQSGNYTLEVSKLAQAHSLSSNLFVDNNTTPLGTGSLTIQVGTDSVNITIDGTNNTLTGLADAINAESSIDATASVIDTGSGYRLVINSNQTGADNAISITVSDDDGNNADASGLSQLAYNATDKNLTQSVIAQDATFKFNGIDVTRSSNTISDLITGVTLTLSGTNSGAPATLTVAEDPDKVADRVRDFVDKFNEFKSLITELSAYNAEKPEESGVLLGDSTIRLISSQSRNILSSLIPGLENANVRALVDVGISTNKDTGVIEFDREEFKTALNDHPDDVVALFADQGRVSDPDMKFVAKSINTVPGDYAVNISQLATHGSFTGTVDVSGGVSILDTNNTFQFSVDGVSSGVITVTGAPGPGQAYTMNQLITELQTQINADTNLKGAGVSVSVGVDGSNQLTFTSTSYGSASKVEFTSVDSEIQTKLGITATTGVDGVDVAGTINGVAATGVGQQLSLTAENDAKGIVIDVTGGTTGDRGTISIIKGTADRFVDLFTSIISVDGSLTARTDGLTDQLNQVTADRLKLNERVESLRERLIRQFTSADLVINRLNSTLDFISAQLSALTQSASSKK